MKTGCFVYVRVSACGGVCERNCDGDFAFVSLGSRCTLIFELWSHYCPMAEGKSEHLHFGHKWNGHNKIFYI